MCHFVLFNLYLLLHFCFSLMIAFQIPTHYIYFVFITSLSLIVLFFIWHFPCFLCFSTSLWFQLSTFLNLLHITIKLACLYLFFPSMIISAVHSYSYFGLRVNSKCSGSRNTLFATKCYLYTILLYVKL